MGHFIYTWTQTWSDINATDEITTLYMYASYCIKINYILLLIVCDLIFCLFSNRLCCKSVSTWACALLVSHFWFWLFAPFISCSFFFLSKQVKGWISRKVLKHAGADPEILKGGGVHKILRSRITLFQLWPLFESPVVASLWKFVLHSGH